MSNQHSYLNFKCSNSFCSLIPPCNVINTYADSGASNTSFRLQDIAKHKVLTKNSIVVTQVDDNTMQSTHITNMNLLTLSSAAKVGHVIPNLSSASLLSIGQLCDDDCLALFNKEKVFIFQQNKFILKGKRNHSNGMWTVPVPIQPISHSSPTNSKNNNVLQHISGNSKLKLQFKRLFHKIKQTSQVANISNNNKYRNIPKATTQLKYLLQHVHNIKLISEQVNYIYAAFLSPVKSAFLNEIKQGYFSLFSNLTTKM